MVWLESPVGIGAVREVETLVELLLAESRAVGAKGSALRNHFLERSEILPKRSGSLRACH